MRSCSFHEELPSSPVLGRASDLLHVVASPLRTRASALLLFPSVGPRIGSLFINSVTQRFPALLVISAIDSSRCHLHVSSTQIPGPSVRTRELRLHLSGGCPLALSHAGPRRGERAPAPPCRGGRRREDTQPTLPEDSQWESEPWLR